MKQKKSVPKVSLAQRRKLLESLRSNAEQGARSQSNEKYKIVADTSLLVSGLFWNGPENEVLRHLVLNHELIVSQYIVDELIDFSRSVYPKISRKHKKEIERFFDSFLVDTIDNEEFGKINIRDVADEPIVNFALDNSAIIISSDADFREYPDVEPVILSPQEYQEIFMR